MGISQILTFDFDLEALTNKAWLYTKSEEENQALSCQIIINLHYQKSAEVSQVFFKSGL